MRKHRQTVWSPLAMPAFRAFWVGMSLSTAAFWMQNIAVTWLMKDWSDGDPVLVSLVQTALFLPVMLLSLPAGAISDMFDRRRLLIYSQIWMMAAPLGLAALALFDIRSPAALLLTTLLLAVGNALKLPSQAALMPSLIDKSRLPMAVGLTSMAVNGGRIVGPALAGLFLPIVGAVALFIGNSALYLLYIVVLMLLPRNIEPLGKPKVDFGGGLKALVHFVTQTRTYAHILIRGGLYFCAWSTVLAVVPLMTASPEAFGTLYGVFGLGAVVGASFYGRLNALANRNTAITIGIVGHGICLGCLSLAAEYWMMTTLMALIGAASFFVMTTFQVSAQTQLPDNMRGRGLALMTTIFMGATALSSPVWGSLSSVFSPRTTLATAAIVSVMCALALHARKIDVDREQ